MSRSKSQKSQNSSEGAALLAERLRSLAKAIGSVAKLAACSGVGDSTIRYALSHGGGISAETAGLLVRGTRCNAQWLLTGDGEMFTLKEATPRATHQDDEKTARSLTTSDGRPIPTMCGQRLKKLMQLVGAKSAAEFAKRLHYPGASIIEPYLSGKEEPSLELLTRCRIHLGANTGWILWNDGRPLLTDHRQLSAVDETPEGNVSRDAQIAAVLEQVANLLKDTTKTGAGQ